MNNEIIGISFGLLLPILTLYNRKAKWLNSKVTWLTFFVFLSYGLYGLLYLKPILKNDKIFYFGFCIPIIYWIFDRFFKFLSIKINNRDFILYLRNSNEIDNSLFGKNPHVDILDIVFSISLLAIICISLLIGVTRF